MGHCDYIEKPEALDFWGGAYLCVDVRVLVALLLCSVPAHKSNSWREGTATYGDDFAFNLRSTGPHQDLFVAHCSGRLKPERVRYTKAELTALMDGYPPWYRERVVCAHGPTMPFPIRSDADIFRGRWVVAVGLIEESERKLMALYVAPNLGDVQPDGFYYARTNGSHLRKAVQRVLEILENIGEHILNSPELTVTIKAVRYMFYSGTGSGFERHLPGRSIAGGSISQLHAAQCMFAMTLFNGMVPTAADIQTLRPILAPVLQAAFNGCYEVIQYLKDTGIRLVLPQGLGNDWSRKIYLRDCVVGEA